MATSSTSNVEEIEMQVSVGLNCCVAVSTMARAKISVNIDKNGLVDMSTTLNSGSSLSVFGHLTSVSPSC